MNPPFPREAFKLPKKDVKDRMRIAEWEKRLWRGGSDATRVLKQMWQEAYSEGMKDANKIHDILDEKVQQM